MDTKKKEDIVRKEYEKRAEEYRARRHLYDNREELRQFADLLPKNARVLDAGCGAGFPVGEFLVEYDFEVIGIDFSVNMLKLARENVPEGQFVMMDMNQLGLRDNSFDGLTAFYSIIHVPREKHLPLFRSFHRLLENKGVMLICTGPDEWEAIDEYCGTEMFWSHYSPEKSLQLVKTAGFQIISAEIPERGGEKHYWITARNKKQPRHKMTKKSDHGRHCQSRQVQTPSPAQPC